MFWEVLLGSVYRVYSYSENVGNRGDDLKCERKYIWVRDL